MLAQSPRINKATLDAELTEGCPSCAPRPSSISLTLLEKHIAKVASQYPAIEPNADHLGYSGMVLSPAAYAIDSPTPFWEVPPPPDIAPSQFSGLREEWERQMRHWKDQQTMKSSILKLLSKDTVIPKEIRPCDKYPINMTIPGIFSDLRGRYGEPTPGERSAQEAKLNEPYDPQRKSIELFFEGLKEVYLWSQNCGPPFSEEQIVQKALTAIERSGHFALALEQWRAEPNKTFANFRNHMIPAYTTFCNTIGSTTSHAGGMLIMQMEMMHHYNHWRHTLICSIKPSI